jgi:hypothetical protein
MRPCFLWIAGAAQVADEIGRDQSAVAFAVCRPAPTRVVAIAADAVGGKEWVGPKNKETRIAGGGAAIRVSENAGGGNPHFTHFNGSAHHSSTGNVGNRTG